MGSDLFSQCAPSFEVSTVPRAPLARYIPLPWATENNFTPLTFGFCHAQKSRGANPPQHSCGVKEMTRAIAIFLIWSVREPPRPEWTWRAVEVLISPIRCLSAVSLTSLVQGRGPAEQEREVVAPV